MYYVPHGNLLTQTTKENKHRPDAARNVGCAWRTRKLDTELDEAPWQHQGRPFPGHPAAAYKASPQNRMERKTGGKMKEKEYIDATDLTKLRIVQEILSSCYCADDPNKTRILSISSNIDLMISSLYREITVDE